MGLIRMKRLSQNNLVNSLHSFEIHFAFIIFAINGLPFIAINLQRKTLCIPWIMYIFLLASFLVCWVPFFSCNILDALSIKYDINTSPGNFAFQATTLLGYINSCVNPIIYTIFNPEFRKAFRRVLGLGHWTIIKQTFWTFIWHLLWPKWCKNYSKFHNNNDVDFKVIHETKLSSFQHRPT